MSAFPADRLNGNGRPRHITQRIAVTVHLDVSSHPTV